MDGSEIDYAYEAGFVLALELIAAGAPLMFGLALPDLRRRRRIERKESEAPKPRASVSAPVSVQKPRNLARVFASFLSGIIATRAHAEPVASYPVGSAREFSRRYLELTDNPKDRIRAGDMQKRYAEDCARAGVEQTEAKAFSQELQELVQYGKTAGGRPYYQGVKWRAVPLPLATRQGPRVVVDNTLNTVSSASAA